MKGFLDFIRKQGVVGLATGFLLGGSISKFVTALVDDLVNPLLGLIIGSSENLGSATITIGSAVIKWGNLLGSFINFLVIAAVVYAGFLFLKLDRLDKKD